MKRTPVESSDVVSIGYDPSERVMEVEFHEGRLYRYMEVPQDIYDHFLKAESFGGYFNSYINGYFRYRRVEADGSEKKYDGIALVTSSARKFRTLQAALKPYDIPSEQLDLPIDEIQSTDPDEVATKKAKHAHRLADRPVLVTDISWSIVALRGFPGAYMHDVANWFTAEDFLRLMDGKQDRTVIRTDILAYCDGKRTKLFKKDYHARMVTTAEGEGLSIDELVVMPGHIETIAKEHEHEDIASTGIKGSAWEDFAKWYNMQRKLKLA